MNPTRAASGWLATVDVSDTGRADGALVMVFRVSGLGRLARRAVAGPIYPSVGWFATGVPIRAAHEVLSARLDGDPTAAGDPAVEGISAAAAWGILGVDPRRDDSLENEAFKRLPGLRDSVIDLAAEVRIRWVRVPARPGPTPVWFVPGVPQLRARDPFDARGGTILAWSQPGGLPEQLRRVDRVAWVPDSAASPFLLVAALTTGGRVGFGDR